MTWDYGKLTAEVDMSGKSRFFFHFKGSEELQKTRDFIEAMNSLGSQGWECFQVFELRDMKDDEEFPGIRSIREAFFRRVSD